MILYLYIFLECVLSNNWKTDFNQTECGGCRQYHSDGANFSSVLTYENTLVIGARNALYKLNFDGFVDKVYKDSIVKTDDYEYCVRNAGQREIDCHNYYTMIIKISDTNLFVCGTAAFNPSCGWRTRDDLAYSTAEARVQYIASNPHTSIDYLRLSNQNYTAYVATAKGSTNDFVIARVNMMPGSYAVKAETSAESNNWLNSPKFVYSFEETNYVYFVYKEIAVEPEVGRVYSRIARICKDDMGDTSPFFNKMFLTFSKVRLQCSYSRTNYVFNEISGAYYKDGYLYATFSGSNSIIETGSVFCLFRMSTIEKAFQGKYRYWEGGRWKVGMPSGAPFRCGGDPNWGSGEARSYQLLAEVVKTSQVVAYTKHPLQHLDLFSTNVGEKNYKILHAGSRTGVVVRVGFHINKFGELESVRSRAVHPGTGNIIKLTQDSTNSGSVYVISPNWVTYVPIGTDCTQYTTCQGCSEAFPVCGWCVTNILRSTCTSQDHCITGTWQSAFEQCKPLAEFRIKPQETVQASENDRIVIDCQSTLARGSYWINQTGILNDEVILPVNGSLIIPKVKETDAGCYICELRGESGVVSSKACLTVLVKPYFVNHMKDVVVEVSVGKDATLPCKAGGYPIPRVVWRKLPDHTLPEGATLTAGGDLKIIRAIEKDGGDYQCGAENDQGESWSGVITLKVTGSKPDPKHIEQNKSNKSMISLVSSISVVFIVIILSIIIIHYYCRNKNKKKFSEVEQNDTVRGFNTYLDPRLTPIGSLRGDTSLGSVDNYRQCYNTANPHWLPPHTIFSAPLGDNMPPPPYQHFMMDRAAIMNSMAQRGAYENLSLPRYMTTCSLPGVLAPSSPTEQVPIYFPHDRQHPNARGGGGDTGVYSSATVPSSAGYYVPYNPVSNDSSNSTRSLGLYSLPRELLTPSSTSPNASITTRNNNNNNNNNFDTGDIVYSVAADRRQPHLVLTNPIDSRRHLHNNNGIISQIPHTRTPSVASSSPLIPPPPLPPTPSPITVASPTSVDSQMQGSHENSTGSYEGNAGRDISNNNHIYDEILVSGNMLNGNGITNSSSNTVEHNNSVPHSVSPPPIPPRPSRSPPSIPQR